SLTLSLLFQAISLQYKSSTGIWYVVGDDLPLGDLDARFEALANKGAAGGYAPMPNVVSKTANYTAAGFDVVLCDATSGSFTITLPSVSVNGRKVTVKKTDASVNTVTISPASGTIDGAASLVISTRWVSYDVIADGTNWYVI